MTYTETVKIRAKEFERINRLLSIDCMENMTDKELHEAGANTHHNEGIFAVDFADGSTLTYDLRSGTSNYYDDVVWTSGNGKESVNFDCEFDLDDIEFEIHGNTYIVKIEKEVV